VICRNETGHASPFLTLAILLIMGTLGYLAFDSLNPAAPSELSISSMLRAWTEWSWWAQGLSVLGPIVLVLMGTKLDKAVGLSKLPPDEK